MIDLIVSIFPTNIKISLWNELPSNLLRSLLNYWPHIRYRLLFHFFNHWHFLLLLLWHVLGLETGFFIHDILLWLKACWFHLECHVDLLLLKFFYRIDPHWLGGFAHYLKIDDPFTNTYIFHPSSHEMFFLLCLSTSCCHFFLLWLMEAFLFLFFYDSFLDVSFLIWFPDFALDCINYIEDFIGSFNGIFDSLETSFSP